MFFAVIDFLISCMTVARSVLMILCGDDDRSCATTSFRAVVVGLVGVLFGLYMVCASMGITMKVFLRYLPFYWSWAGRGIFFIVLGCIIGGEFSFGLVAFIILEVMGFTYVILAFVGCCNECLPPGPIPICLCGAEHNAASSSNEGSSAPKAQHAPQAHPQPATGTAKAGESGATETANPFA